MSVLSPSFIPKLEYSTAIECNSFWCRQCLRDILRFHRCLRLKEQLSDPSISMIRQKQKSVTIFLSLISNFVPRCQNDKERSPLFEPDKDQIHQKRESPLKGFSAAIVDARIAFGFRVVKPGPSDWSGWTWTSCNTTLAWPSTSTSRGTSRPPSTFIARPLLWSEKPLITNSLNKRFVKVFVLVAHRLS